MNNPSFFDLEDPAEFGSSSPDVAGEPDRDLDEYIANAAINAAPRDTVEGEYVEDCKKCRGSGRFISYSGRDCGQCFACNGKGTKSYKTSPETRAHNRRAARATRADKKRQLAEQFMQSPHTADIYLFLEANASWSSFCADLLVSGIKYGSLTERQEGAIRGMMAKMAAKARAEKKDAPVADLSRLVALFDKAREKGLKSPKILLAKYRITRAKDSSKNAGYLYIKIDGEYAGKVSPEGVCTGRGLSAEVVADLQDVVDYLGDTAKAHGHTHKNCCFCAKGLDTKASQFAGYGPVCAEKYGLEWATPSDEEWAAFKAAHAVSA